MEDNVLQSRCEKKGLTIDRTHFFPIGSPNILQLFDGIQRIINKKDPWRAHNDDGIDGLITIHRLTYTIEKQSLNPLDNIYELKHDNINYINIKTFMTGIPFEKDHYYKYDLREPPRKIIHPNKIESTNIENITDDWSNIPFYPSNEKKTELIDKYGEKNAQTIIEYSYKNSKDPTKETIPPELKNINKYSKSYAKSINAKQKATASANIRLGGIY
jgi:hypothetical protein